MPQFLSIPSFHRKQKETCLQSNGLVKVEVRCVGSLALLEQCNLNAAIVKVNGEHASRKLPSMYARKLRRGLFAVHAGVSPVS